MITTTINNVCCEARSLGEMPAGVRAMFRVELIQFIRQMEHIEAAGMNPWPSEAFPKASIDVIEFFKFGPLAAGA